MRPKSPTVYPLLLAVIAVGLCSAPATAAYKPENVPTLKGDSKKQLSQALSALKALPRFTREAILADMLGLTFTANGNSAKSSNGEQSGASLFIGSDAKRHEYWADARKVSSGKWSEAWELVSRNSREAVLAPYAKDITRLVLRNAKHHLNNMPEPLRDAWLAYTADLLYLPGGQSAYTGEEFYTIDNGTKLTVKSYDARATFMDTTGQQGNVKELVTQYNKLWFRRWLILCNCVQLVGKDDILALFPKELEALIKHHESKALADHIDPQQIHLPEPPPGTDPAKVQKAQEFLKTCPLETREALMADMLQLTFTTTGESSSASNGWRVGSAYYFGTDDNKHLYWDGTRLIGSNKWSDAWAHINSAGMDALLHACSAEVYRLILSNAKGHLASMPPALRDAWLADAAELLTLPNGKSAYTGQEAMYESEKGLKIPHKEYDIQARYVDSTGKERLMATTLSAHESVWGRRIVLLYRCASIIGAEKILETFANDVAALRKNNKPKD